MPAIPIMMRLELIIDNRQFVITTPDESILKDWFLSMLPLVKLGGTSAATSWIIRYSEFDSY